MCSCAMFRWGDTVGMEPHQSRLPASTPRSDAGRGPHAVTPTVAVFVALAAHPPLSSPLGAYRHSWERWATSPPLYWHPCILDGEPLFPPPLFSSTLQ